MAESEQTVRTRLSMQEAGWVYAENDRPGIYVPGPELNGYYDPQTWMVSEQAIREFASQNATSAELLAFFGIAKDS